MTDRQHVEGLIREARFRYRTTPSMAVLRLADAAEELLRERDEAVAALRELARYVRAHLSGQDADPELRYALEQADEVVASSSTPEPTERCPNCNRDLHGFIDPTGKRRCRYCAADTGDASAE